MTCFIGKTYIIKLYIYETLHYFRKFLGLSLCMTIASCHSPQPTSEITWSTFNIRYDNPYDSLNSWTYRKDTVANFIKAQNLDIVGMQEVLHHQLET